MHAWGKGIYEKALYLPISFTVNQTLKILSTKKNFFFTLKKNHLSKFLPKYKSHYIGSLKKEKKLKDDPTSIVTCIDSVMLSLLDVMDRSTM